MTCCCGHTEEKHVETIGPCVACNCASFYLSLAREFFNRLPQLLGMPADSPTDGTVN